MLQNVHASQEAYSAL